MPLLTDEPGTPLLEGPDFEPLAPRTSVAKYASLCSPFHFISATLMPFAHPSVYLGALTAPPCSSWMQRKVERLFTGGFIPFMRVY